MKTKKAILWLIVVFFLLAVPMLACVDSGDRSSTATTISPAATATPSYTDLWKKIWDGAPCPESWNDPDLGLPDRCNGITHFGPIRPAGN